MRCDASFDGRDIAAESQDAAHAGCVASARGDRAWRCKTNYSRSSLTTRRHDATVIHSGSIAEKECLRHSNWERSRDERQLRLCMSQQSCM